jgi:hypothetical protein
MNARLAELEADLDDVRGVAQRAGIAMPPANEDPRPMTRVLEFLRPFEELTYCEVVALRARERRQGALYKASPMSPLEALDGIMAKTTEKDHDNWRNWASIHKVLAAWLDTFEHDTIPMQQRMDMLITEWMHATGSTGPGQRTFQATAESHRVFHPEDMRLWLSHHGIRFLKMAELAASTPPARPMRLPELPWDQPPA